MKRREFLFSWIACTRAVADADGFDVEVMEVFHTSTGCSALLVHHADAAARAEFARWLHAHSGSEIRCQPTEGRVVNGQIFRLKMCFGRGLLLTRERLGVQAGSRLRILL